MNTTQALERTFIQSAIAGVIAGGAMKIMEPNGRLRLFGSEVDTALGIGITVAGASAITEVSKDFILAPKDDPNKMDQHDLMKSGITGAAVLALLTAASPQSLANAGYVYPFVLGAGSEAAGTWAYLTVVKPWWGW